MSRSIAALTLVVDDYDKAIRFYTEALKFSLVEDTPLDDGKRWVRVAPHCDNETSLLLACADTTQQKASIGNQSGGRVFLFYTQMILSRITII